MSNKCRVGTRSSFLKVPGRNLRLFLILLSVLLVSLSCEVKWPEKEVKPNLVPIAQSISTPLTPNLTQSTFQMGVINKWLLYEVNVISWSKDSIHFALGGEENDGDNFGVYAYSVNSSGRIWIHELANVPFSLTFTPNGQTLFVPLLGGSTFFLDATTGQVEKELDYNVVSPCIGAVGAAFSLDGSKLLTLDSDLQTFTRIYIWDLSTNRCLGTLLKEQGASFGFESSHDGQLIALALRDIPVQPTQGIYDQQIQVWNVDTQQVICSFKDVKPVAFSVDGKTIAAASVDMPGAVDLWDVSSCNRIDTLVRHEEKTPYSIAFSPDSQYLAIGGVQTVQLWQVASRKLLFESNRLQNNVKLLSFSPNGEYLLSETDRTSINDKATITLWRVTP